MRTVLIFLFFLMCLGSFKIQPIEPKFFLSHDIVTDYITVKGIDSCYITLKVGNKNVSKVMTDSTGKFPDIEFYFNKLNRITFSRKGYLTRIFEFDTRNIPKENQYNKLEVNLPVLLVQRSAMKYCEGSFKQMESRIENTLKYNPKTGEMDWDWSRFKNFKSETDTCLMNFKKIRPDK